MTAVPKLHDQLVSRKGVPQPTDAGHWRYKRNRPGVRYIKYLTRVRATRGWILSGLELLRLEFLRSHGVRVVTRHTAKVH